MNPEILKLGEMLLTFRPKLAIVADFLLEHLDMATASSFSLEEEEPLALEEEEPLAGGSGGFEAVERRRKATVGDQGATTKRERRQLARAVGQSPPLCYNVQQKSFLRDMYIHRLDPEGLNQRKYLPNGEEGEALMAEILPTVSGMGGGRQMTRDDLLQWMMDFRRKGRQSLPP